MTDFKTKYLDHGLPEIVWNALHCGTILKLFLKNLGEKKNMKMLFRFFSRPPQK